MKNLIAVILFVGGFSLSSFAQKGVSRVYVYHPRVIVGVGAYAPFYPYYGLGYAPYFGYPWYGYPMNRPSKMDMKIEDIRNDYHDKIKSAKADKSLTKAERKETVKNLKKERDLQIEDLKKNYYKH